MGKKKEVVNEDFSYDATKRGIVKKTGSKISELVMNMMAYGGLTIDKGNIIIWGDPCYFIPLNAYTNFYNELRKKMKECDQIFYWLGKMTAKNAMYTLIDKYGLNKENLPEMVSSATQDGFGYLSLVEVNDREDKIWGKISGKNSTFSMKLKELFGKQKNPADHYIQGLLSGGSEGLFKKPIRCIEEKCMAKGDLECLYSLNSQPDYENFSFFKDTSINEIEINEKTKKTVIGRKSSFKPFGKKDVKFGDGKFVYRGCVGVYFPTYTWMILEKLVGEKVGEKEALSIQTRFAKDCLNEFVDSHKEKEDIKYEPQLLQDLVSFLGMGEIEIKRINKNHILISSANNPSAREYTQIFNRSKKPIHNFLLSLIKEFFLKSSKRVEVVEASCISEGKNVCSFMINLYD